MGTMRLLAKPTSH